MGDKVGSESVQASAKPMGQARGPAEPPLPIVRARPLKEIRLAPPFDAFLGELPEAAAAIPSMMSLGEKQFLYGIARDYYVGAGMIVDAGIFMGGSTMCLGSGVRDNPHLEAIRNRWGSPIMSCELGITNGQMLLSFKKHGIGEGLAAGDSFGPILENHIAPVRDLVDLRLGDITQRGAIADPDPKNRTPVEILFLDVLKSPELNEFCLSEYFPRLIPRRSLVIQQDYLTGDLPFIQVYQEFFASKFEFVGELASSAVFRLNHRITRKEVEEAFGADLGAEKELELVAAAGQRSADAYRRLIMTYGTLRMVMRARGLEAARDFMRAVEIEYGQQIADERLRRVQNVVRASRYLCEHGLTGEKESMKISTGHRGADHRRTDLLPNAAA